MRPTSSTWSSRAGTFARESIYLNWQQPHPLTPSNPEISLFLLCVAGNRVTGILGNVARHRRALLVASQAVRYRHPIPPFRPYEIRSQLVFSDDEWMYFLHQFQCPTTGKLYAEGLCRASCRQDGKTVSAAKLYVEVFGGDAEALQTRGMPDVVKQLLEWDGAARIELETPDEAARRERETALPSADKKVLAQATRSWNLPV
ncbi:hypothetical protein PHYSODRAFT_285280 [Phytophthora sojae]|uniref:Uncharacterized protein n=1 Tax=Phytophthora sojae (strain P6497) TaxID=1094619 RepID=G4Z4D2_PHYSP|nr:hypothetical protein PHYSODRAFT_285280 [Phytophthora sojae]EGZ19438.1 hypothetical protein PHYSODRAFT_285280 [Phytophthora sojae]|eukprot:XP_009522155.1 hypothetical protein PHYSODRAFT_285280 [Phytophthora sojae]